MIQVKGLTKVYKSRRSGKCTALDHISFTLPDRGFVFVIGKSGSGKTTLLSLLGGLDSITSGEIIENGRHVEKFSLGEQVYYRNSTIGFIFQDFHLIDELTIFENVALALDLQGERDGEKVQRALENTGLGDQGRKYPKELSGGQKQRVAIARALVKEPSVILADEPTGNLDSKTTAQILDILKELSKTKLVVIVSHNLSDAERYADEILELSDGKILQHLRRNPAFDPRLRVENNTLVIPCREEFDDENLREVAQRLWRGVGDVRQDGDRFRPCSERGSEGGMSEKEPLKRSHLRARERLSAAVKLSRRGWLRTAVYALIFAAIMVVLSLAQLIMNFNGGEVLASEMAKRNLSCTSFLKGENSSYEVIDATRLVDVEAGDLDKFYDAGYEGKAYPLVNYSFLNRSSSIDVKQMRLTLKDDPYALSGTAGLLLTEESFVEKTFGKLEYAALAEEPKDYGVYLTDFFADAFIAGHPQDSYQTLLGPKRQSTGYVYGYVNGIIDTDYRERYGDLLRKLADPALSKAERSRLAESDEGLAFADEVYQYLAIAYSFDEDFIEKAVSAGIRQFVSAGISTFTLHGKEYEYTDSWFTCEDLANTVPLAENEAVMSCEVYNELFDTAFTSQNMNTFTPHEVKLTYYLPCDREKSREKYETTLTIIGLNDGYTRVNVADNIFRDLQRVEGYTCGYYFDSEEDLSLLFNAAEQNGFVPNSSIAGSVTTMTRAVGVFSRFFGLIFVMLCAALFLLMVQYELKSIRDKIKDIGILKALGARNSDLMCIFGFRIAVAGLLMAVLYILGSFVFIGLANRILVLSLNELVKNAVVMDLDFLIAKGGYLLGNCLLALGILLLSFVVPMLRLRSIKPTNVIKAKE